MSSSSALVRVCFTTFPPEEAAVCASLRALAPSRSSSVCLEAFLLEPPEVLLDMAGRRAVVLSSWAEVAACTRRGGTVGPAPLKLVWVNMAAE
eukprot:4615413-Pyramimonas_sp.AAC.2